MMTDKNIEWARLQFMCLINLPAAFHFMTKCLVSFNLGPQL